MRISHGLLFALFFVTPELGAAETMELMCIHPEYRMTLTFAIDTDRNTIVHDGVRAREVHIDKSTISFIVDLTSGAYFHFISRASGNMTVKAPHGTLIYGFECANGRAKF